MIVVNWWLSLTKTQQQEHKQSFAERFSRPTASASPLGHRTSAAAAAHAEQEGIPFQLVTVFDDNAMKQTHLESTSSYSTLDNCSTSYRKQGEQPPP